MSARPLNPSAPASITALDESLDSGARGKDLRVKGAELGGRMLLPLPTHTVTRWNLREWPPGGRAPRRALLPLETPIPPPLHCALPASSQLSCPDGAAGSGWLDPCLGSVRMDTGEEADTFPPQASCQPGCSHQVPLRVGHQPLPAEQDTGPPIPRAGHQHPHPKGRTGAGLRLF